MEPFLIAARSSRGHGLWLSLASSDQVWRRRFCPDSGPKFSLSGHGLPDLTDMGGFSGNLGYPTSARFDCRIFISCELEQTRRFFSKTPSKSRRARSDRTVGRCHLLAFKRSSLV